MINVFYEINPEWLYGSNENGDCGQFPANFIEYVPSNLPRMPTTWLIVRINPIQLARCLYNMNIEFYALKNKNGSFF